MANTVHMARRQAIHDAQQANDATGRTTGPKCDQCAAVRINGLFCHETGCPNQFKAWSEVHNRFVKLLRCWRCNDWHIEGERCPQDNPTPNIDPHAYNPLDSY